MKKVLSLFLVLSMVVSFFFLLGTSVVMANNTTYYVSFSSGSDTNNGTSSSTPWKTLAKVGSITYGPGDQILLKCGDTWNEQLTLTNLRGDSNIILISSYGTGNKPRITRNSAQNDTCISITETANIKISNLDIRNAAVGMFIHNSSSYGGNITIEDCYFQDITGTVSGNPDYHVPACIITGADADALMDGVLINNCEANNGTQFNSDSGITKNLYIVNTIIYNSGYGGISASNVEGGYMDNCRSINNGTVANPTGTCGVYIGGTTNFVVRNTEISGQLRPGNGADGCGIDFEGVNSNVDLQNVNIHDCADVGVMILDNSNRNNDHCDITNCTFSNNLRNPYTGHPLNEIWFVSPDNDTYGTITNNQYYLGTGVSFINSYDGTVTVSNNTQLSNPPTAPTFSTVTPPTLPTIGDPVYGPNRAAGKVPTGSCSITDASKLTDGIKSSLYYSEPISNNLQWIQIDFGASYDIDRVKLWHYYLDGRTYHDVIVAFSNDSTFASKTIVFNNDTDNSAGLGVGSEAEYVETSEGKVITFNTLNARYMRLWTNGNNLNGYNHYVEVEAFEYGASIAAGKVPNGSCSITNASKATNGVKSSSDYADLSGTNLQWIQIDLGASYNLERVKLWHYFADGRTYHDVIVALSNDSTFASKTIVFNNDTDNSAGLGAGSDAEYVETAAGKTIMFSPSNARYIRLWSNGNNLNGYNHYVEVEAFRSGLGPNWTAGKVPNGSCSITNASKATNGSIGSGDYAELTGANLQWIQIDLGASYNVNRVKLWHYFADARTYYDVIVALSNDPNFATKTIVFNNDANNSAGLGTGSDAEYCEPSIGKEIIFSTLNARYVRLWTNGSNLNGSNHYVEVQVFGI